MANIQKQYVGARYVPKFADPQEWNSANAYEALVMVTHNNTSYISGIPVPAGVDITNTDYWLPMGSRDAYIEALEGEVASLQADLALAESKLNSGRVYWRPLDNAQLIILSDNSMATYISTYGMGWPCTQEFHQITSAGLAWTGENTFLDQFKAIINQSDFSKNIPTNVVVMHGLNSNYIDAASVSIFAASVEGMINAPTRCYIVKTGNNTDVATGMNNPMPNQNNFSWLSVPCLIGAFGGNRNAQGAWNNVTAGMIINCITDHYYRDINSRQASIAATDVNQGNVNFYFDLTDLWTLRFYTGIGALSYSQTLPTNTPVTITLNASFDKNPTFDIFNYGKILMEVSGYLEPTFAQETEEISLETEASIAICGLYNSTPEKITLTFSLEYVKGGNLSGIVLRFPPQVNYTHNIR